MPKRAQSSLFDAEPEAAPPAQPPAPAPAPADGIGRRVPPRHVLFPKPAPDPANIRAWRRILSGK